MSLTCKDKLEWRQSDLTIDGKKQTQWHLECRHDEIYESAIEFKFECSPNGRNHVMVAKCPMWCPTLKYVDVA